MPTRKHIDRDEGYLQRFKERDLLCLFQVEIREALRELRAEVVALAEQIASKQADKHTASQRLRPILQDVDNSLYAADYGLDVAPPAEEG